MPLGTPALATPSVGGGGSFIATASFTPSVGDLLIAIGGARLGASLPGAISLSSSALTFTALGSAVFDDGTSPRMRAAYWATVAATAPSMTVSINSTSAGKTGLMVVRITGAGGTPANHITATSASGDPSMTLGTAPASASCCIAALIAAGSAAITPPSGFTELDEQIFNSDLNMEVAYDAASAPTSAAYSTTNTNAMGIYLEIVASSGASRIIRPRFRQSSHMLIR